MRTEHVLSVIEKVVSRMQTILDDEYTLKKSGAALAVVKKDLFDLCYRIDEDEVEDADSSEISDVLTEVIDAIEDLTEGIGDGEVSENDVYDEVEGLLEQLTDLQDEL